MARCDCKDRSVLTGRRIIYTKRTWNGWLRQCQCCTCGKNFTIRSTLTKACRCSRPKLKERSGNHVIHREVWEKGFNTTYECEKCLQEFSVYERPWDYLGGDRENNPKLTEKRKRTPKEETHVADLARCKACGRIITGEVCANCRPGDAALAQRPKRVIR